MDEGTGTHDRELRRDHGQRHADQRTAVGRRHAVRVDREHRPECPDQRLARPTARPASRPSPTLQVGVSDPNGGPADDVVLRADRRLRGGRGLHDRRDPRHAALRRRRRLARHVQPADAMDRRQRGRPEHRLREPPRRHHRELRHRPTVEWQRADAAMDILDNAGIPNNLAPGNHDMSTPGAVTSNLLRRVLPAEPLQPAGQPVVRRLARRGGRPGPAPEQGQLRAVHGRRDRLPDHPPRDRHADLRRPVGGRDHRPLPGPPGDPQHARVREHVERPSHVARHDTGRRPVRGRRSGRSWSRRTATSSWSSTATTRARVG